jgi:hypothetical protein
VRLYLGGQCIGIPEFGTDGFDQAAFDLRGMGHEVFNPIDHDRSIGFDATGLQGTYAEIGEHGVDRRALLMADIAWIMQYSEGMVALTNWVNSPGARMEIALHQGIYLPVWELPDFLQYGPNALKLRPLVSNGKEAVLNT